MRFNVCLRPLEMNDAVLINKLRQDPIMERFICGSKRFVPFERDAEWVKKLILNDDKTSMYFGICTNNDDVCIGYTSISEIDYRNGTCFWSGIKLSPAFSGKGYGFQIELLILKLVFEELRMVRCQATGMENHYAALAYMEKAGFVREGLMRKHVYKDGAHQNVWLLSMTGEEYILTKEKYEL